MKGSTSIRRQLPVATLILAFLFSFTICVRAQQPPRQPILRIETGMHTSSIINLDMDAANQFLATAAEDDTVRVWELVTGKLIGIIRPPLGGGFRLVRTMAMSPDGSTIAIGTNKKEWDGLASIYLFNRQSGKLIKTIHSKSNSAVDHLAYSKDGQWLAATGYSVRGDYAYNDGVRIYEAKNYTPVAEDTRPTGSIDFDSSGRLISCSWNEDVRIYRALTSTSPELRLLAEVKTDIPYLTKVKSSPDGTKIAIVSREKIEILSGSDLSKLNTLNTSRINSGTLESIAWSLDSRTLYVPGRATGDSPTIRQWADAGRGGYQEFDVNGSISGILPLKNGGVAYATYAPGWGVLSGNGQQLVSIQSVIIHFRRSLLLSADGGLVQFSSGEGELINFSAADRELAKASEGPSSRPLIPAKTQTPELKVTDWSGSYKPKLNGKELQPNRGWTTTLAIAPDRQHFILGSFGGLRFIDASGVEKWFASAPYAIAVNISQNGKFAVVTLADGTIRWYRMTDGKELLAFFPHNDRKRWVAWTPDGYYDASPGAEELIGWHVNNGGDQAADFYPIGQFFEKFYHPKLLAQVFTPEGVQPPTANAQNTVDITKELKRPPIVHITSPKTGASFNTDAVQISIEATDQGGGVDEIRLYQNGKVVSDETRQLVQTVTNNKTFSVTLVPGVNTFRATAFNKDRTESNPVEVTIELKAAEASSDLYILAIGLNEYKNAKYNLNYGRADAQAFADSVEQRSRKIFRRITKQVILDDQATRLGIEEAFNKIIAQAKPQDAFVFYFAGHGVMSEGDERTPAEFYLVPYEVVRLYGDDGALASNGVAARLLRDLCTKVRAQKQLIVLDACQSAGALETFATRGAAEEKAVLQLARSAGVVVIAATGQDQVATEFVKLGHGVFTYALLQAISGDADGGNPPDGKITATEIVAFINDRVPELTKQYRGKTQYPNAWVRGQDFPLGVK